MTRNIEFVNPDGTLKHGGIKKVSEMLMWCLTPKDISLHLDIPEELVWGIINR